MPPLAMGMGVFILAAGSAKVLSYIGYEHAPFMVLAAGLFAGGVVAIFK